jgi:hypothetical protein
MGGVVSLRAQHGDVVALQRVVHKAGVACLGRVELAGAVYLSSLLPALSVVFIGVAASAIFSMHAHQRVTV